MWMIFAYDYYEYDLIAIYMDGKDSSLKNERYPNWIRTK